MLASNNYIWASKRVCARKLCQLSYCVALHFQGRRGLGNIYVFACGNGAGFQDSCAFDGYVNSIYTIAVASIEKDGTVTGFSERCSAIMTAVYSSNMVCLLGVIT